MSGKIRPQRYCATLSGGRATERSGANTLAPRNVYRSSVGASVKITAWGILRRRRGLGHRPCSSPPWGGRGSTAGAGGSGALRRGRLTSARSGAQRNEEHVKERPAPQDKSPPWGGRGSAAGTGGSGALRRGRLTCARSGAQRNKEHVRYHRGPAPQDQGSS